MKKVLLIFVSILTVALVTALFPYPVFSKYTNISKQEAYQINNFQETEIEPQTSQNVKILDLQFEQIDAIFPRFCDLEIIAINSNLTFFAKRTGGKNHFDIEPIDTQNAQALAQIAMHENKKSTSAIWDWMRIPVLVKLNDFAFLPASLSLYPHGYQTVDNSLSGHFCLHFRGSKTDGTNQVDDFHQESINLAKKNAKKFVEENAM